ncbi:MAG: NAD(P)H-binding protein [Rhodopirellula sp.]|nr:NAD(P)H-binding protein [Rhodopirellula sp.]
MSSRAILIQFDCDSQPSVFDGVVAIDSGVDHLLPHANVRPENVRELVYGAIFTRAVSELHRTAIFIGGSDVAAGEAILAAVRKTFFGPMRVSVMLDANGANTTAAAAVLAAAAHVDLRGAKAAVLAATGPVGRRVVQLLAASGAEVRAVSRNQARAVAVCEAVAAKLPSARLSPCAGGSIEETERAVEGVDVLVAAGAAGVELLPEKTWRNAAGPQVAVDLNAVPPVGLTGIEATDRAAERRGVVCYGAIGVGGMKMKIHKAAIRRLFESNDQVLDAEEIFEIGRSVR